MCPSYMGCTWNEPVRVQPSLTPNVCTHSTDDREDADKVAKCILPTNQGACEQDGCQWNTPHGLFSENQYPSGFCYPSQLSKVPAEKPAETDYSECLGKNDDECSDNSAS